MKTTCCLIEYGRSVVKDQGCYNYGNDNDEVATSCSAAHQ